MMIMKRNLNKENLSLVFIILVIAIILGSAKFAFAVKVKTFKLPKIKENATLTFSPEVPPLIKRRKSAVVKVHLDSSIQKVEIKSGVFYNYWSSTAHSNTNSASWLPWVFNRF